MSSVTQRIKEITKEQDRGGYVPARSFKKIVLDKDNELNEFEKENIHASLTGLAVDYLTRYMNGTSKEEAFKISLLGANVIKENKKAKKLLDTIMGLDNASIMCACKIVGYDVCLRFGEKGFKPIETISPNIETIENIRIMVNRSLKFFEQYGPITKDGFTFEGAYNSIIDSGDGDFLTKDTLWDFKVSKTGPTKDHTLQLLIYYLMGKRSIHKEFQSITKLGIFNPRLNTVYIKDIAEIDYQIIEKVEHDVIGYGNKQLEYEYANRLFKYENVSKRLDITYKEAENKYAPSSKMLTTSDIMKIMGVSRGKVTNMIKNQGLPMKKVGNRYLISEEEFFKWKEEQSTTATIAVIVIVLFIIVCIFFYL